MQICAYQCHRRGSGDGFIMAFRRPGSQAGEAVLHAEAVDAVAEYAVEVFRGGMTRMSGAGLINLELALPTPRSCKLLFYKKAK
jgi:hypothetical protein